MPKGFGASASVFQKAGYGKVSTDAAAGGVLLLDTFTRADSATLGANWSITSNVDADLQVVSNTAKMAAGGTESGGVWIVEVFGADQAAQIKLDTTDGTGSEHFYLMLNVLQTTAPFTGYLLDFILSASTLVIDVYRANADAFTAVATGLGPYTNASGDTWRVTKTSGSLAIARNGSTVTTPSDSSPLTNVGYAGFGGRGTTILKLDDFTAGSPATGARLGARAMEYGDTGAGIAGGSGSGHKTLAKATGYGVAGADGFGVSASQFAETGFGKAGADGFGTSASELAKTGFGKAGADGFGDSDYIPSAPAGTTSEKTGYAVAHGGVVAGDVVLDNFNRADDTDLGSNWTHITSVGANRWAIEDNEALSPGSEWSDAWTANTFDADAQEVSVTLGSVLDRGNAHLYLFLQVVDPAAGSFTGYLLDVIQDTNLIIRLYRGNAGSFSLVAEALSVAYTEGDTVTLRQNGDTFTALFNGTPRPNLNGVVDVSPLNAVSYVGFGGSSSSTATYDDFTIGAVQALPGASASIFVESGTGSAGTKGSASSAGPRYKSGHASAIAGVVPFDGIVDSFNRADAATLGANWAHLSSLGTNRLGVAGNEAVASGGSYADYYTQIFAEDFEISITLGTVLDNTNAHIFLAAGIPDPSAGTFTGYLLDIIEGNPNLLVRLYHEEAGVATLMGEAPSVSYTSGHTFTLTKSGDELTVLRNGVPMTNLTAVVDPDPFVGSGYVGLGGSGSTTLTVDNFATTATLLRPGASESIFQETATGLVDLTGSGDGFRVPVTSTKTGFGNCGTGLRNQYVEPAQDAIVLICANSSSDTTVAPVTYEVEGHGVVGTVGHGRARLPIDLGPAQAGTDLAALISNW